MSARLVWLAAYVATLLGREPGRACEVAHQAVRDYKTEFHGED